MASTVAKFYPIYLLNDLIYEGEAVDGDIHLEKIQEELYYQDPFSTCTRYIFKDANTGKYYRVTYEKGSIESQVGSDFYGLKSSDGTKVGCFEVKPVDVTTTEYKLVLVD